MGSTSCNIMVLPQKGKLNKVCEAVHVALHMFTMQFLANQLPYLATETLDWLIRHYYGPSIA